MASRMFSATIEDDVTEWSGSDKGTHRRWGWAMLAWGPLAWYGLIELVLKLCN